jgi:hypothetical protein
MGKSKIVYIIGAGASYEFMIDTNHNNLSTHELNAALKDIKLWRDTIDEIKKVTTNYQDVDFSADDVLQILNYHDSLFDTIYIQDSTKTLAPVINNFELKVAFLDFLATFFKESDPVNKLILKYNPIHFLNLSIMEQEINKMRGIKHFKKAAILAREVLHRRINDFMICEDGKQIIRNYFEKKIGDNRVNIYSLNYDSLLDESLGNGLVANGFDNAGVFNTNTFMDADNTVAYLHGNQYFYGRVGDVYKTDSYDKAFRDRCNGLWGNTRYPVNQKAKSVSLITGIDKEKEMQTILYSDYYLRLAKDIIEADEIICIGYSCRDDHINSMVALGFRMNKKVSFVVGPDEDVDKIKLRFTNKMNINYNVDRVSYYNKGAKNYYENI